MEVTLRPTGRFESFSGIECRMWEGKTSGGTSVEFYVPCVRTPGIAHGHTDLDAALKEIKAERQLVSFDTRLVV
jgi:hypothetical protein